jgi:hypothetical protein
MAENTPQIRIIPDADKEVLTKNGLIICQTNDTEVAVYNDEYKLFVPGAFGQSDEFRKELIPVYDGEFRSKLGLRDSEVFWAGIGDLTALINQSEQLRMLLEGNRIAVLDSSTRYNHQFMAGVRYMNRVWEQTDWCDCGFMSGAVLLTVRPRILTKPV